MMTSLRTIQTTVAALLGQVTLIWAMKMSPDMNLDFIFDPLRSDFDQDARALWTGRSLSNQCRGAVTRLSKDEATVLKSHYGYGSEPYPDNYQCRWLFIPDDCSLGVECSLGTEFNRRRGRAIDKCVGGDYLRVLGYRGTSDSMYCGHRTINQTFSGQDAVALVFRSTPRPEESNGRQNGLLSSIFQGFNCKIVCKGKSDHPTTTTPPSTSTMPSTTTTTSTTTSTTSSSSPTFDSDWNCRCGETRQGRIVCPPGANCTVTAGSIPWQAAIVFKGRSQPWCGGSVINDRYILTAGHCVSGKSAQKIQVVLGDHDWTTNSDTVHHRFNVDAIKVHSRFGKVAQFDYDYALLRLDRPINFFQADNVRPVCLPDRREEDEMVGMTADVSGWGVVDPSNPQQQARRLQKVSVQVITKDECKKKYVSNPVTESMLCAQAPERDACFGDSGGPMTIRSPRGPSILEGVISWGKNCAKAQWPGVYAKVGYVLDWIRQNTQDAHYCTKRESNRRNLNTSSDETRDRVVFQ